ncbi:MAG: type IV secretion system DNA-binding domain-containing protein [Candidatus Nealsonbacteria bacterium]|nr:type IV secretion system DNA-binding domain-containing protein [Candidatus Nealsonbacteria bacterium]
MPDPINFFAETSFRNARKKFGIKTDDRRRHVYVIGKTGMGKTVMLQNMAVQDIQNGKGLGFVDPHGEASEALLDFVPASRVNDVIYINPGDIDFPIAFNIMEEVDMAHRHLVAGGLMGVFKKIWPDVWSARMEYILNNCILALLEYPGATLLGVNRMLADTEYRRQVVEKITDPVVKSFWVQEYARYTQRYEVEATAAIQNKIGQFISAPLIRNIIGQVRSSINMRDIMDQEKILIMNLSKGRVGEDNSRLLGALMITKLQLAAMSRVDIPEQERKDFFLYIDEFQNFATESFTNILSEARKYRLALILGHQYIKQMDEKVSDAVFGNVGTIVTFRVGADDAEYLEKEFTPEFLAGDLVNLGKYNIYLKLMIDGLAGRPFSATTLPPIPSLEQSHREAIIKFSREKYSTPRSVVEEKISQWTGLMEARAIPPVSGPPVLYDAKCSLCGKETKVTFRPDGIRPVYCKPCRKKIEQERETRQGAVKEEPVKEMVSLKDVLGQKPVYFAPSQKDREDRSKPKRKEVNLDELRKVIGESMKEESGGEKGGVINPGETIKF